MAKIYLDPGHGGSDPGAVKYLNERDVNLVMALACRDYLQANGVIVKMSRTSNETNTSINSMAKEANSWEADYVVSIHNNAGGGDGFEVYHTINGGKGKALAKNIETEVKKIGQNSRGLKTKKGSNGDYFGMIRLTKAPAVICEGVFVDNATDVEIADTTAEQKAFGYAYARGILKTLGITDNGMEDTEQHSGSYLVKVTAKDLYIRKGPGTNYENKGFIKPGVYTIVETQGNWGKLKSGAGWICLDYAKKI
ncbi:N-acetylmuramoyl-L-alanine amidase [Mogibacterium sp. NSJ-24]|mgnify:CR=1 FL=1|uniref:N-acetylmuramoyl-L-alanine amidase n=1 Tax=Lentihominibacter hominis TaxID=2763645 RepID=A0A926I9L8_9FIRM|nr:N-acetylmuramoyl-L-alanine amidase [Lentihominibacter hominis]MBC8568260.1 N-acetylmuramoyl-L-alanine amidase [Lentihominibacter hominis]